MSSLVRHVFFVCVYVSFYSHMFPSETVYWNFLQLFENSDPPISAILRTTIHKYLWQDLLDGRAFRIQRALQCSMLKTVLPKDQWPTYEEDREKGRYNDFALKSTFSSFILFFRYLQPYLKEVQAEKAEKEAWGN